MKSVVLGALLLICGAQAGAAFVSATWVSPGNEPQQSFARLEATARGNGEEQTLRPVPLPYSGGLSASAASANDWAYSYAAETYSLGSNLLQVDVTRLDRNGPSSAASNGAWYFSVTETVQTTVTGLFVTQPSGTVIETLFRASLSDLTAGVRLFDSIQDDVGNTGVAYELGGLVGLRNASFEGQLDNILLPGHVYRLTYLFAVLGPDAGSDNSEASGRIALAVALVPEPSTHALLGLGLLAVAITSKQRRSRRASRPAHRPSVLG